MLCLTPDHLQTNANKCARGKQEITTSIFFEDMSPSAIATIQNTPSSTSPDSYYDEKSLYLEHCSADIPKHIIGAALKERVENIDYEACEPGDEDSFFVADLGEVYRQHMRWKLNLPRVKPFYGKLYFFEGRTKANPQQRSNATLTLKSFDSFRSLGPALTVPPRQKLNKPSSRTSKLPASSMLSHARRTLTFAMLPAKELNR